MSIFGRFQLLGIFTVSSHFSSTNIVVGSRFVSNFFPPRRPIISTPPCASALPPTSFGYVTSPTPGGGAPATIPLPLSLGGIPSLFLLLDRMGYLSLLLLGNFTATNTPIPIHTLLLNSPQPNNLSNGFLTTTLLGSPSLLTPS